MMGRNVSLLAISIFMLAITGSAASNIILNGTNFLLVTGDSYGLSQGYIIKLKSVSSEGSVWLELESDNKIIKSEIIHLKDNFTYNRSNKTLISIKIDKIYAGPGDTKLVSFFPVYQYVDPEMPPPRTVDKTSVQIPEKNTSNVPAAKPAPSEYVMIISLLLFVIMLLYILRKLW